MSIIVRSNEKPLPPSPLPAAQEGAQGSHESQGRDTGTLSKVGEGESKDQSTQSAPGSKESEQKEASDSETEAGETVETKKEGEEGHEGHDQDKDEPHKKKGGFQRRIDKLNAQKAQIQQEMEYWKQQALKSASATKNDTPVDPERKPSFADPNAPVGKPKPESFETHAEYVEALADWKTEQKLRERDEKAQAERINQEQSKLVSSYQERMKAFSAKTPDFQEMLMEVDHIPISPALRDIILNSDNGPELAYELAKVPGEYERIAKLPPLACAREMGKFEARLSSSSSKASTTEKKLTQAPKPLEPVGTGGKGSVSKSIFDPTLTQAEYEALRREQMKKKGGK